MKRKKLLLAGGFLLLLLCTSLFFLLPSRPSVPDSDADEAFQAFTQELFLDQISSNTLTLHYTLSDPAAPGISSPDISLGDISPDAIKSSAASLENMYTALSSFSPGDLSEENRLTYDILDFQLQQELALAGFPFYEEILSPTLGIQAQLPVLLAEYTFRSEQDIQDYLALLSQVDTYYEGLLDYEREKAEAGLFMSDETADDVIAQCQSFIADRADHFLLTTFQERVRELDFLSEEDIAAYVDSDRAAVFGHVFPAYEKLISGLQELKGSGTNDCGLAYYERGKEYYVNLVAATVGTGHTISEIRQMTEEQMSSDLDTIAGILADHPELLTTASRTMQDTEPLRILETLEEKITDDFPAIPAVSCQVKYVDPSLEDYLSPAFYLTPPLDCMTDHVIYINPAGDYDSLSLFTTLAHEGYPGHLYQTIYENSCQPDPVRRLFDCGGYIEGWATYVEWLSYSYTGLDPDMAALLAANSAISLGIYARCDIGIHYDGWTEAQTGEFLADYGITSPDTLHRIYQAVVQDPGNYLKYYLGAVEILKIKEQAAAALSDKWNLKAFHEFILSTGPAPFPVIESRLEQWLNYMSAASTTLAAIPARVASSAPDRV